MGLKYDDETLKRYLLGRSDPEEQAGIEQELIIDTNCFEQFMVVKDELFDDYIDEELSPADRQAFEESVLSTPDGQKELGFARDLKKRASESRGVDEKSADSQSAVIPFKPRSFLNSPILKIAAAIIVVGTAAFLIWHSRSTESDLDRGLVALRQTYPTDPLDVRITDFGFAPKESPRGVENDNRDLKSHELAKLRLEQALRNNSGAVEHHALGQYYLADGKFDQAIGEFKKAIELDSRNAKLECDCGAALLEKGKTKLSSIADGQVPPEFQESLEHLNKSIVLDGSLLDARFNRALLYQAMNQRENAEKDWQFYLAKDPNSPWSTVARRRLDDLKR